MPRSKIRFALSSLLSAAVLASAPAIAADCVWGKPGYRDCIEEKVKRLRESEGRGERPATGPTAPPDRRPQSLPPTLRLPERPDPTPVREWRAGPPADGRFTRDADLLRERIDRRGPSAASVRDVERELLRMSGDAWRVPAAEANRRQFETDMLRRRALDRELFSDPPNPGRPVPP